MTIKQALKKVLEQPDNTVKSWQLFESYIGRDIKSIIITWDNGTESIFKSSEVDELEFKRLRVYLVNLTKGVGAIGYPAKRINFYSGIITEWTLLFEDNPRPSQLTKNQQSQIEAMIERHVGHEAGFCDYQAYHRDFLHPQTFIKFAKRGWIEPTEADSIRAGHYDSIIPTQKLIDYAKENLGIHPEQIIQQMSQNEIDSGLEALSIETFKNTYSYLVDSFTGFVYISDVDKFGRFESLEITITDGGEKAISKIRKLYDVWVIELQSSFNLSQSYGMYTFTDGGDEPMQTALHTAFIIRRRMETNEQSGIENYLDYSKLTDIQIDFMSELERYNGLLPERHLHNANSIGYTVKDEGDEI